MSLLQGEVAIVAGGGRGFGKAIAIALAEQGAAVCVVARNREEVRATSDLIRVRGGMACDVAADLTQSSDTDRAVEIARKKVGAPGILIFSAGVPGPFGPLWLADPESWWEAMTLHIRAPALLMTRVLPEMIDQKRGHIVLVSSLAGNGAHAFMSAYCLGKGAQTHLAALVDCETREFGVRIFAINPGLAFTQMAQDTVNSAGAKRFLPGMVGRLSSLSASGRNEAVFRKCADRCVQLVSGRYDALGGQFLDSESDFDELLSRDAASGQSSAW